MIIKEILFDIDTGLLWFNDSKGTKYQCNIYGDKQKQFYPKISGIASATERKKAGKQFFDDIPSLSPKRIDYCPISNKLECYSQFPRPLVRPMSNIVYSNRKELLRDQLVFILQLNYGSTKAKHFFTNGNQTQTVTTLSYSTRKLAKEKKYMIDTKKILELINNTFHSMFCNKANWKIDIIKNQVKYKALKKLEKLLQINNYDINVYHYGIKLNNPSNKINRLYSAVNHVIHKTGLNREKQEETIAVKKNAYRPTTAIRDRHKTHLDTDLSFLSQKDTSFSKQAKIKTEKNINCITENEKKYIRGYRPPKIQQRPIIRRDNNVRLKTNLDLYLQDCDLQSKVNPTQMRLQTEKNRFDDELFKKKKKKTVVCLKGLCY